MKVRIGLTDGTNTEIEAKDLAEGTEIVMGEIQPGDGSAPGGSKNPFLPQFGNRRGGGGGGGGGGGRRGG